jgi:hypothetical protein
MGKRLVWIVICCRKQVEQNLAITTGGPKLLTAKRSSVFFELLGWIDHQVQKAPQKNVKEMQVCGSAGLDPVE